MATKKTKNGVSGTKAGESGDSASVVGRAQEREHLRIALGLNRNVLIEGPVGVGKTYLVQELLKRERRGYERVDGDSRYTEQKLTGWFDPPLVLKRGFAPECFIDGPLVTAMRGGRVLFINELNRMPESVQNILLPAMDERRIVLPKLGLVAAREGFAVVAPQNPREVTATHALSEALLDRFEMLRLDYQTRDEELEILRRSVPVLKADVVARTVDLIRATRQHAAIKRGASIRAGLAIGELVAGGMDYQTACLMALPSRIEMISSEDGAREILLELLENAEQPALTEKKKTLHP